MKRVVRSQMDETCILKRQFDRTIGITILLSLATLCASVDYASYSTQFYSRSPRALTINAQNLLRLTYEPDDGWHDGRDVAVDGCRHRNARIRNRCHREDATEKVGRNGAPANETRSVKQSPVTPIHCTA